MLFTPPIPSPQLLVPGTRGDPARHPRPGEGARGARGEAAFAFNKEERERKSRAGKSNRETL